MSLDASSCTLSFGTAGVRAPLGDGPSRMNPRTVALVVTGIARYLLAAEEHEPGAPEGWVGHLRPQDSFGSDQAGLVVVAGDARHGSADFVRVAAEVLVAHGFQVVTPGLPVPTPVLAAAVRSRGARAGIMVTASHNPRTDNGLKVYGPDGAQIVPPTDALIEAEIRAAAESDRTIAPGDSALIDSALIEVDPTLVDDYLSSVAAALPRIDRPIRVALTPLHGVGGQVCTRLLQAVGVEDVTVVAVQAEPDPDFPTTATPNPEYAGTVVHLLELAKDIDADVALALDPDADRCAVGTRGTDGSWRMLDGDETGLLLADYLLRHQPSGSPTGPDRAGDSAVPVVASSIVSSRMGSLLVEARGGHYVETLTGFKWLVRAGQPLLYAYEEALGHCALPHLVADKDGMSAAALWCAMLAGEDRTVEQILAELTEQFGLHLRRNTSVPVNPEAGSWFGDADAAQDQLSRAVLSRAEAAARTLGPTARVSRLSGTPGARVDIEGGRAILRPSGTEPRLKTYCETWTAPHAGPEESAAAARRLDALCAALAQPFDEPG